MGMGMGMDTMIMAITIMDTLTIMVIRTPVRIAMPRRMRMFTMRIAITTTIMAMTTRMGTATRTSMTEGSALPLLVWLSPSFPVGAFAYSHGLEWAVEAGDITDAQSCQAWIADLLDYGSGRTDAILLAAAWRAVMASDEDALRDVAELAVALQPSGERHLEATAQGNAFMTASRSAWPSEALSFLMRAYDGDVVYPVAVGVAGAGFSMPLAAVLDAFLLGFATNLVSSAVRLGPIGQTDGQRTIAGLLTLVRKVARETETASLDNLGSSVFRSDIATLRHETQYTRLFRS
jgi:urease accessory protein